MIQEPRVIKRFFRIGSYSIPNLAILGTRADGAEGKKSRDIFITLVQIGLAESQVFGANWMSANARPLKYLLGWLIAGTRGGVSRAKIIQVLRETPQNANQLANLLGMDYRTIRHHLGVLEKNRIITSAGEGYGTTYFLSPAMEENYVLFEEILNKIWKK